MTLIASPTITPLAFGSSRVTWSGTAGKTVSVYLNGKLAYGPTAIATAGKEVVVSIPDPGTIEVHEGEADETIPANTIPLERRPLVWWSSVSGASEYRIYIDEVLVGVVAHEDWRAHHQHQVAGDVRLDGAVWGALRVEAVTAAGVETSTTALWKYLPGVLLDPTAVAVTGGSGVFDITLTVP